MQSNDRRLSLESALERLIPELFGNRVLSVDRNIAKVWGRLEGKRRAVGRPLAPADGLLAATALEHELALVTRNIRDFAGLGITVVNPWDDALVSAATQLQQVR
jgi:toxin FitB